MKVTGEMAVNIARLARLRLTGEELEKYSEQLSGILEHMAVIAEADVEGVEPMFHACPEHHALRDDTVRSFNSDDILDSSINVKDKFFSVPAIISDGE